MTGHLFSFLFIFSVSFSCQFLNRLHFECIKHEHFFSLPFCLPQTKTIANAYRSNQSKWHRWHVVASRSTNFSFTFALIAGNDIIANVAWIAFNRYSHELLILQLPWIWIENLVRSLRNSIEFSFIWKSINNSCLRWITKCDKRRQTISLLSFAFSIGEKMKRRNSQQKKFGSRNLAKWERDLDFSRHIDDTFSHRTQTSYAIFGDRNRRQWKLPKIIRYRFVSLFALFMIDEMWAIQLVATVDFVLIETKKKQQTQVKIQTKL